MPASIFPRLEKYSLLVKEPLNCITTKGEAIVSGVYEKACLGSRAVTSCISTTSGRETSCFNSATLNLNTETSLNLDIYNDVTSWPVASTLLHST